MKRFFGFLLILSAVLFMTCAVLAEDGSLEGISPGILEILSDQGLENCAEDYICLSRVESPKKGVYLDHTFVLVSKDGIHHDVYHFTKDQTDKNADQSWKLKAHYDSLAPQGKGTVAFRRHHVSDRTGDDLSLYQDDQGFLIYRIDPDYEEYWMQGINVHVMNYQFQVVSWFDRSKSTTTEAYVRNGKIYFFDWDADKRLGNVNLYTTFGLNISFKSLPKSYKEAKETFSDPPQIPSGSLTAERIQFTSNKKYSVYSGPSEYYLRGGNGKASVSTNDWIQVFGRENGWIMIQYDITSDHMRIGWIAEEALPKKTVVKELGFGDYKAYTAVQCVMTDDPLFSRTSVATIPAGTEVKWLSTMGGWIYVEWEGTSQPVRGFIQSNSLTKMTEIQAKTAAINTILARNSMDEQQPVTREILELYSVTFDYDPLMNQWTVGFDSGRDYRYTVVVNDQTGDGWLGSENG